MGQPPHESVNIASPEFKKNPYPFYARLRAEAPVYRMTLATKEFAAGRSAGCSALAAGVAAARPGRAAGGIW